MEILKMELKDISQLIRTAQSTCISTGPLICRDIIECRSLKRRNKSALEAVVSEAEALNKEDYLTDPWV